MVDIVVVSHSAKIADGIVELVLHMAGGVEIVAVGGDSDGGLGTDPERMQEAIEGMEADDILVLMDIGSAVLSAETVLEMLSPEVRERVRLVDAPLVEGAFSCGVTASTGADVDECVDAATEARTALKLHDD